MRDDRQTDDEELVAQLRQLARRMDPEPADVVAAARSAFAWHSLDAELAALSYDSMLDDRELAGVRGVGQRLLTFEAPALTVELEIGAPGSGSIVGQLVPPGPAHVVARWPGGSTTTDADELGRFQVSGVPSGPVSLRLRPGEPDAAPVDTDWLVL